MKIRILFAVLALIISGFTQLHGQTPEAEYLVNIHRATTTEMNSITTPDSGSLVYNSDSLALYAFDGTLWQKVDLADSTDEVLDSAQINADSSHFYIGEDKISAENAPRVFMGTFKITSTGDTSITGLPFKPSLIKFTAYANVDEDTLNADNQVGNNTNTKDNSFNFMTGYAQNNGGTIEQQVICGGGNGTSINDISRFASPSMCIGIRYGNQNGDNVGETFASLKTFDTNGFTINVSKIDDNIQLIFIAYR